MRQKIPPSQGPFSLARLLRCVQLTAILTEKSTRAYADLS